MKRMRWYFRLVQIYCNGWIVIVPILAPFIWRDLRSMWRATENQEEYEAALEIMTVLILSYGK